MTETELTLSPKSQAHRGQLGARGRGGVNVLSSRGHGHWLADAGGWSYPSMDTGVPSTNWERLFSDGFELKPRAFVAYSAPSGAYLADIAQSYYPWSSSGGGLTAGRSTSLSESLTVLLLSVAWLISPEVVKKLQELVKLERGWDGDDAKPVRVEALGRVLLLLRMLKQQNSRFDVPFIAPTFDGHVLLEWITPRRTLEVQTKPRGWSIVGSVTHHGGRKDYFSASADHDGADIVMYYEWFRDELLIWPTA